MAKVLIKRFFLILMWVFTAILLPACGDKATVDPALQGSWELRLLVPNDQQGRCVDEKITFDQTSWRSDVVVHSTFTCNQPYYSVSYKGDVVAFENQSGTNGTSSRYPDSYIEFKVENIKLVAVADINKGEFDYLSANGVKNMESRLLDDQYREWVQVVNVRQNEIRAKVFSPVLAFVTEDYKHKDAFHIYRRRY